MPLKGNPITQNRGLSGPFLVSLGPKDGDRKGQAFHFLKQVSNEWEPQNLSELPNRPRASSPNH